MFSGKSAHYRSAFQGGVELIERKPTYTQLAKGNTKQELLTYQSQEDTTNAFDGEQSSSYLVTKNQHNTPSSWQNTFDVSQTQYQPIGIREQQSINVDRADGIRKVCLAGLVISAAAGVAAIIVGVVSKGSNVSWHITAVTKDLAILLINVILLIVTECLGYIHAVSLRWALFYEGRLDFNTNLRLTTFSKKSTPNGAFFSFVFFVCIALTYAAGNMLLVFNTSSFYISRLNGDRTVSFDSVKELTSLTKVIPICMGITILIMCTICLWSINCTIIPSWSSDPFNTAAAALNSSLVPNRGRAMMSVHDRNLSHAARRPAFRQKSLRSVSRYVTWILATAVAVLVALIIWSAVIVYVGYRNKNGTSWAFFPTTTANYSIINGLRGGALKNDKSASMTVFLFFFASAGMGDLETIPEGRMIGVLLFYLFIQSVLTIGLHCAELQCQLARDELVWRTLDSGQGSIEPTVYNSLMQPLKSWQCVGLLLFKPVMHWLFGSALQVDYGQGLLMRPPQIVYMTIAWLLFVLFLIAVSTARPKGYLPASYGHLQTMADVADMWAAKMFWGDKGLLGEDDSTHHAGTSHEPLPPVSFDYMYA